MLRDELHKPLGLESASTERSGRRSAIALAAIAALVAAGAAGGEASLLRAIPHHSAGLAEGSVPADLSALRASPSDERPAKPLAPPPDRAMAEVPDRTASTAPARAPHVRDGAPGPLIIDVRQALAALREQGLDAPTR